MAQRSKVHKVMIAVHFDAPVSNFEARYAVWNNLDNHVFHGDGRQQRGGDRLPEPYVVAHVRAAKARRIMKKLGRPKKKPAPSERDPNTIDMFEGLQQ